MPYSSDEGKHVIHNWLTGINPRAVLDIGAGAGTYGRMVRAICPQAAVDAVEIFEPYVSRFDLSHVYDAVIIGDVRDVNTTSLFPREYDVIIMGDVLEHMTAWEAEKVWCTLLPLARHAVIVSIPVVEYPQGPSEGNVHEAHVSTWDVASVLKRMPEIDEWWVGSEIGVFRANNTHRSTFPLPVGAWT
jgi:hypothetical protein